MNNEDAIKTAYRLLLGREPDPSGLASYTSWMHEGATIHLVIEALMRSSEYKTRHAINKDSSFGAVEWKNFDGLSIAIDPADSDVGMEIQEEVGYEPHVTKVFRKIVAKGDRVLDIGANIGYFSMLAAKLVGTGGKVVAIEPNPHNVQLFLRSLKRNGFSNVALLPVAAGDNHEVFPLSIHKSNGTLLTWSDENAGAVPWTQCHVLQNLIQGYGPIDIVKIDVEGFEPRIISSLTSIQPGKSGIKLITEFHPFMMKKHGFDPMDYLGKITQHWKKVHVIHHDGETIPMQGAQSIMNFWKKESSVSPVGEQHHLDLLGTP